MVAHISHSEMRDLRYHELMMIDVMTFTCLARSSHHHLGLFTFMAV